MMNTQQNMNGLRSRRGVTIVEVVIALVIITIVSAAAMGIIMLSVDVEADSVAANHAATSAENVVECFRFAQRAAAPSGVQLYDLAAQSEPDAADIFKEAMEKLGYEYTGDSGTFILDGAGVTVTIQVDFTHNNLAYSAVDADGEKIYSYYYPRRLHNTNIVTAGFESPTTKNNVDLVNYVTQAYEHNWGYVSGTWGQVLTEDLLEEKLEQYPKKLEEHEEEIRKLWMGGRTADCIGLIKGYLWLDPVTVSFDYNSATDKDQEGYFYEARDDGKTGALNAAKNNMPEVPGIALWREGHIGVYVGDGKVIHASNFDVGVICTNVSAGDWTHWMYIPGIAYPEAEGGAGQ